MHSIGKKNENADHDKDLLFGKKMRNKTEDGVNQIGFGSGFQFDFLSPFPYSP
jgi:hypothetical protein